MSLSLEVAPTGAASTPATRRARRARNKQAKRLQKVRQHAALKKLRRVAKAVKQKMEQFTEEVSKCDKRDAGMLEKQTMTENSALKAAPKKEQLSVEDQLRKLFVQHQVVEVARNKSPGFNSEGGVGKIVNIQKPLTPGGPELYTVEYVIGKRVERDIPLNRLSLSDCASALKLDQVSSRRLRTRPRKKVSDTLYRDQQRLREIESPKFLARALLRDWKRKKPRAQGWRRRQLRYALGLKNLSSKESPALSDEERNRLRDDIKMCETLQLTSPAGFGYTTWGRKQSPFTLFKLSLAWGLTRQVFRGLQKSFDQPKQPRANAKGNRGSDGGTICMINDYETAKRAFTGKQMFRRVHGKFPKGELKKQWDALSEEKRNQYKQLGLAKLAEQPYIAGQITAMLLQNPNMPYAEIATRLENWCTEKVIRNWIQSFESFDTYRECIVPAVSAKQKAQQVEHARKVKARWNLNPKPGQKFLFVHYDEKWFYGLVLRARAKKCPQIGVPERPRTAKNAHHINKVMAVAVVGYCFTDDMQNGGDGIMLGLYRCQKSRIAGRKQMHKVILPDGSWVNDESLPPKYLKGDAVPIDVACTGAPSGDPHQPKFDLLTMWLLAVFPLLEKLVAPGGKCEGAKVVIQGDGAGTHRSDVYQTAMREECRERGWVWDTQAPHMPHSNVLDLALFPMMSKRHDSYRHFYGGVLKPDEIWDNAVKVWNEVNSVDIAKSFLTLDRVLDQVILRKGEVSGIIRNPPRSVPGQHFETRYGYRRYPDAPPVAATKRGRPSNKNKRTSKKRKRPSSKNLPQPSKILRI